MDVEVIQVLDLLPGMVFTALPDGRIEFMNKSLLQRLGLDAASEEWPTNQSQPRIHWQSRTAERHRFSLVTAVRGALEDRLLTLECNPSINGGRVVRWYGSVWAETNPGNGATVGFSVPIHQSGVSTDSGIERDSKLTAEIDGSAK